MEHEDRSRSRRPAPAGAQPPESSPPGPEEELLEGEVVPIGDELPVLVEARVVEQPARGSMPVVQTAVAVATGFVAGAAPLAYSFPSLISTP